MSQQSNRKQKSLEYAAEVEEAKLSYQNKKAAEQIKNAKEK